MLPLHNSQKPPVPTRRQQNIVTSEYSDLLFKHQLVHVSRSSAFDGSRLPHSRLPHIWPVSPAVGFISRYSAGGAQILFCWSSTASVGSGAELVGFGVGLAVGLNVGLTVGLGVGVSVGYGVGDGVGSTVGFGVGFGVGSGVGSGVSPQILNPGRVTLP
jgi:hypothetical protein